MNTRNRSRTLTYLTFSAAILATFMFLSTNAYGWDNCPFGEVNEPFPGTCGRYIDTDHDNICDLSQPSPEFREGASNNETLSSQVQGNTPLVKNSGINYYFLPIAGILFLFYLLTYYLSKKKKIKLIKHRKLWNSVLLLTFLVSGMTGIILAILLSYGIRLTFYSEMLFWHVETGIAMAIISIFHIIWHWKYFKSMLRYRTENVEA